MDTQAAITKQICKDFVGFRDAYTAANEAERAVMREQVQRAAEHVCAGFREIGKRCQTVAEALAKSSFLALIESANRRS